ncbi:hypothetical protein [Streptomyces sp. NPDC002490]|uniref:hypothetical protein n=1 Tax=Streptomyces sp. NPDC002490 TaxID=3154416 RepID=UPI003322C8EF
MTTTLGNAAAELGGGHASTWPCGLTDLAARPSSVPATALAAELEERVTSRVRANRA